MSNEGAGHYYDLAGKPCHTQPTKKGAKNPTRPTRVSDAKEQKLLPSVSTYLRVLSNPGLDRYKQMEVVKACYNCLPGAGETLEEYTSHILEKSTEDASGAADLGSQIHKALETYFKEPLLYDPKTPITLTDGSKCDCAVFVEPAVKLVAELDSPVLEAEAVLVHPEYGYAGMTDLIVQRGILDFKSKRTKPGVKVEPNESHVIQIAAYVAAHNGRGMEVQIPQNAEGFNLYISTTEPGRVELVHWDYYALASAWEVFQNCLAIWRYRNGYDPRVKAE